MIWVFVFGGIALAGLVMLVAYAVWLAHKASDVFAELRVLGARSGQIAEVVSQIKMPDPTANPEETPAHALREPLPQRRGRRNRKAGAARLRSRTGHS